MTDRIAETAAETALEPPAAALGRRPRLARMVDRIGIQVTASDHAYVVAWPGARSALERLLLVTVLGLYALVFVTTLVRFPLWGMAATIDEQLQYYQVGRNYSERGFGRTMLLPDLSTGSTPAQHPYLYTHQPPGPQLLIGLLMRLFGERYVLIRTVFAVIFFVGMWYFVKAGRLLPAGMLHAPALLVLLMRPSTVVHAIDHPAYCAFPFCAFFPLVALDAYHNSGRRRWLVAAAAVTFVASNYLIYGPMIMMFAFWVIGAALKLLPIKRGELALLLGLALLGLTLHLLQPVLLLGWSVATEEIRLTLSNRVLGRPSRAELAEFFQAHNYVLYGGHTLSVRRFAIAAWQALSFPGRTIWLIVLAFVGVAAGWTGVQVRREGREMIVSRQFASWLGTIARAALWIGVSVLTPMVMFPAFSSDYTLSGTSEFLLALFCLISLFATLSLARRLSPRVVSSAIATVVIAAAGWVGWGVMKDGGSVLSTTYDWIRDPRPEAGMRWIAENFAGQIAMTNVDPTVIGFFTREAAFGGCHRSAVLDGAPDPTKCYVHFIRGYPTSLSRAPSVYVWFREGNKFCVLGSTCIRPEEVADRYPRMFTNAIMEVFDLTRPLRQPGGQG